MTTLEGRVIRRATADRRPRPTHAASSRSRATSPTRLGAPPGCSDDPRGVRRARPRLGRRPADYSGSPTPGSTPARPCTGRARPPSRTPGRRDCSSNASPRADGRARLRRRSTTSAPPTTCGADAPRVPGHRPGAAALPVGRADPPGRRARRAGAGAVRRAPPAARRRASASRRASSCGSRRPAAWWSRGSVTDAIRPDTVFMPFHWAGDGQRQPAHQRRDRPGLRHAGVQGVRRAARRGPSPRGGPRMRRVVVVGNGMVGARFVEELRRRPTRGPT